MAITSRFKFIGEALIPKKQEDFIKEWMGGQNGKTKMKSLNFRIKESERNAAAVDLFGSKTDVIKTKSVDGNNIDVPWEERNQEETLRAVAFNRKFIVNLGEPFERKEFICSYDMIDYLSENLPNFKGKLVVTGTWEKNPYDGRFYDKFRINNVYAAKPEEKSKLILTMDFFTNSESVDMSDFKSEKKIRLDGFLSQYDRDKKKNVYMPQSVLLSAEKYDMENPKHVDRWNLLKKYAVDNLSKKKMKHLKWECRYINGSEEVEFDESMLTSSQKQMIELGFKTLDDFKPKGSIYGDKIREVRLFTPELTGQFADGLIECEETIAEFEENVFSFAPIEKLEDVLSVQTISEDDDEEDLF